MKKSVIVVATILLAATGVAASAQDAQQAEQPQEEKKICRTDRATGSLTRRTRICMTRAQWDELSERTRRGVDEMGRSASGSQAVANNPGSNGPLSVN